MTNDSTIDNTKEVRKEGVIIMSVGELITELKKYDPEMRIELLVSYDGGYGYAGGTVERIEEEKENNKLFLINEYC